MNKQQNLQLRIQNSKFNKQLKIKNSKLIINSRGFVLLEALVSITLIMVAVLPLVALLPDTLRTGDKNLTKGKELILAEKLSEDIKLRLMNDFTSIPNGTGTAMFDNATDYRYSTWISDATTDKGKVGELKVIKVEVFRDLNKDGIDDKGTSAIIYTKVSNRN
ncbi:MAG: hypothetical protein M1308_18945 [Actinobacteria bacterium]|nr:hypothetical protein [Actinomycetota bacterium]